MNIFGKIKQKFMQEESELRFLILKRLDFGRIYACKM